MRSHVFAPRSVRVETKEIEMTNEADEKKDEINSVGRLSWLLKQTKKSSGCDDGRLAPGERYELMNANIRFAQEQLQSRGRYG